MKGSRQVISADRTSSGFVKLPSFRVFVHSVIQLFCFGEVNYFSYIYNMVNL